VGYAGFLQLATANVATTAVVVDLTIAAQSVMTLSAQESNATLVASRTSSVSNSVLTQFAGSVAMTT